MEDATSTAELTTGTKIVLGNYTETDRLKKADLGIGINIRGANFTVTSVSGDINTGKPSFSITLNSDKCDKEGKYYICYIQNLPVGGYEVSFTPVPGYTTPFMMDVQLIEGGTVYADYDT